MDGNQHTQNKAKRWPRWPAVALATALIAIIALSSGGISAAENVHGAVYDWARANPGQDVPVLVQTDGDSAAVADFIRSSGGTVQREFQIIPAVEADVSRDFVSTLAGHSDVAWISLDAPVVSTGKPGGGGGCSRKSTDTDADGMCDDYENANSCLDPLVDDANADPDGDGTTNIDEKKAGTDPCVADSGGGGGGGGCTVKGKTDTDCDGMIDNYENKYACLDPLVADADADPDGDGTTNIDEKKAGTDPCVGDSGGGGGSGGTTPTIDTTNLATAYPFAVNAPDVWNASTSRTGSGVTVAVVDTGITNDNKDFKEGKKSRVLFDVAVNPLAADFDDGYGHGTHVTGIIGGDGDLLCRKNCGKYIGIAPDANFVDVKLADEQGNATLADVIAGLEFVYNNKDTYNIRVVNLSLTSSVPQSYTADPLDAAVEFLWFNGIVVVVAAGNLGDAPDAVSYPPANDPFVIVTGAFDDMGTPDKADDALASWSSRGTTQDGFDKPDVVAPGRRIISDIDTNSFLAGTYPDSIVDSFYFRMSGTSMSAPVVSGMVALILEEHPEFTPGQVKYVLQDSFRYVDGFKAPLADEAVFYTETPGDTNDGLTPSSLLFRPAVVVPVGVVAYVLGSDDPVAEADIVGLDLEAAGIAGTTLDTVDWGAIKWGAIKWDAIKWDAIKWGAIKWGAIKWGAIKWDAITWDGISWDAITWDAIKWDAITWDAITWGAIKWDAIKWSAIKWGAIKWSSSVEFDAIKWGALKWSAFPE